MRLLAAMFLATTVSACALPVHKLSAGYRFDSGREEGVVVGSLRVDTACSVQSTFLWFEGLTASGANKRAWVGLSRLNKADFENPRGFLHIDKFPAGEWRFTRVIYGPYQSRKDLDYLFTVKPGVITYLGEITIHIPTCERFNVKVADERVRDGALFDARMEHLKSRDFQVQFPAPAPAAPKR